MVRIRFFVAYDGRCLKGWQSQPCGNTIQDSIEQAFTKIIHSHVRIHASGRTDAGVHALGQVFHVDVPDSVRLPMPKWPVALNSHLPASIRILEASAVSPDFHARFSATGKTYRYCISAAPILSPFDAGLAWHRPHAWDAELLAHAVALFMGTHDFRAFAALRGNEPAPIPPDYFVRSITEASVSTIDSKTFITLSGSGFLYKMVRLMVGAAFDVARGKLPLADFQNLITAPTPTAKSPLCAPADGLTLMRVHY